MTNSIRPVPEIRTGVFDSVLARNGDTADGGAMAVLANLTYASLSRRGRVLYSRHAGISTFFASGVTHRGKFYSGSQNLLPVFCTVIYGDSGVAGTAGFASFNVDGIAQSVPTPANTATATAGPSGFRMATFEVSKSGALSHTIDWAVSANSAVNGVIIYEGVFLTNSAYATVGATSPYAAGAITGVADFEQTLTAAWAQWSEQSTHHFSWSGTASVVGTTYANILDASTAGYSLTTAGFWTIPLNQATRTATTVACKFWVYAATSVGTTGRARLVNGSGVLGTITGIGTAGAYYEMDVALDPTVSSDLVLVEISDATAGRTITVTGAGLYNLTT